MRRLIYALLIILIFVLAVSVSIRPAIIFLVKSQLKKAFSASDVSLGDASLSLTHLLLLGLEIKKEPLYYFRLKQLEIKYLPQGEFYLEAMQYNKAKIKEAKGKLRIKEKNLFLDSLSAEVLDGQIQGDFVLSLTKDHAYSGRLKTNNINLETLVKDFELQEKLEMTGRLTGALAFRGRGVKVELLSGNFSLPSPGGRLFIKDTKFLENMAGESNQPLHIIIESFKNYRYNRGNASLALEEGNLILQVALDGDTGKRNLKIVLHDFRLRKEEK